MRRVPVHCGLGRPVSIGFAVAADREFEMSTSHPDHVACRIVDSALSSVDT